MLSLALHKEPITICYPVEQNDVRIQNKFAWLANMVNEYKDILATERPMRSLGYHFEETFLSFKRSSNNLKAISLSYCLAVF